VSVQRGNRCKPCTGFVMKKIMKQNLYFREDLASEEARNYEKEKVNCLVYDDSICIKCDLGM
jgi:hypothetical protein